MTPKTKGVAYLAFATILYSIMPVLIRTLGKGNIPPISQVFLRYSVACVAAIIYFVFTKSSYRIKKQDRILFFCVALFGYALVNVFYTYANLYTHIGTVLFIFNCSTVMGPVLGCIFLKERISRSIVVATIIGFVSLLFLFSPSPMASWRIGAVFAFISSVGSSLYVIGRKKLSGYDAPILLVTNTVVGVLVVGALSFILEPSFYFGGGIMTISPVTWLVTILFGLDNFLAYLCMTRGFGLVRAGEGSMILLTENVIGIFFAYIFFQEIPTMQTFVGGGLILCASILVIHESFRGKTV